MSNYKEEILRVEQAVKDLGLGGSIIEVWADSKEDNYVSLMIRHQDAELLESIVARLRPAPPEDIWADDPRYDAQSWRYEVANNDTRLGYWDWVASQREQEEYYAG